MGEVIKVKDESNDEYDLYSVEMQEWENTYNKSLTLGSYVKVVNFYIGADKRTTRHNSMLNKKFMVVSLGFDKNEQVMVGLNNGTLFNTEVVHENFSTFQLEPAGGFLK